MKIYKTQHIVSIQLIPERESDWYKIVPDKYIFGLKIASSHITDLMHYGRYSIPKYHIVKNDKIYERPHIIANFSDGDTFTLYVSSNEEGREIISKILEPETQNFCFNTDEIEYNVN